MCREKGSDTNSNGALPFSYSLEVLRRPRGRPLQETQGPPHTVEGCGLVLEGAMKDSIFMLSFTMQRQYKKCEF